MNTQEINSFIENLEKKYSTDEAYIGFFYDDSDDVSGEYTSYIKANKEGLLLYANQLLKASVELQERELNNQDVFEISYDVDLRHSEFKFSHIKFFNKPLSELERPKEHKQTFGEQIGCFIAIVICLLILISLVVGAYTIISSIFN